MQQQSKATGLAAPWRPLEWVCIERLPKLESAGRWCSIHAPAEEDFSIHSDFL